MVLLHGRRWNARVQRYSLARLASIETSIEIDTITSESTTTAGTTSISVDERSKTTEASEQRGNHLVGYGLELVIAVVL